MNVETDRPNLLIQKNIRHFLVNINYKKLVKSICSKSRIPLTKENYKKDRTIWKKKF